MIKRGKFKRALALLLAVCVLCCRPALAAKKPSKATVRKAYQSYITKTLKKKELRGQNYGIAYYDINKDGIQELIVEYGAGVRCGFKFYTYYGKKVKKMHSNLLEGCSGVYGVKGKNKIVLYGNNTYFDHWLTTYTMAKNKLKKRHTYEQRDEIVNFKTGRIKSYYYIDGKKCSKKTFEKGEKVTPVDISFTWNK